VSRDAHPRPANSLGYAGFTTQRPNLVGDPTLPADERTPGRWFNTATANQFTIGSASRSPVRGPTYKDVALAVMRRVGIGEERAIELRLEVFNLLNTAHFGAPAAELGPARFGTITTALDPRVVQLAAKLWFDPRFGPVYREHTGGRPSRAVPFVVIRLKTSRTRFRTPRRSAARKRMDARKNRACSRTRSGSVCAKRTSSGAQSVPVAMRPARTQLHGSHGEEWLWRDHTLTIAHGKPVTNLDASQCRFRWSHPIRGAHPL